MSSPDAVGFAPCMHNHSRGCASKTLLQLQSLQLLMASRLVLPCMLKPHLVAARQRVPGTARHQLHYHGLADP